MFSIRFTTEPPEDLSPGCPGAWGVLRIGGYSERFLANISTWTKAEYETQWREAINAIVMGGERSALMTAYQSPEHSSHWEWWPMFREGEIVYFQNQILVFEDRPLVTSVAEAIEDISPRGTVSEDGEKISEWKTTLPELERFLCAGE